MNICWVHDFNADIRMLFHFFHHQPKFSIKNELSRRVSFEDRTFCSYNESPSLHFCPRFINLQHQSFIHYCNAMLLERLISKIKSNDFLNRSWAINIDYWHFEKIPFLHLLIFSFLLNFHHLINNFINWKFLLPFYQV